MPLSTAAGRPVRGQCIRRCIKLLAPVCTAAALWLEFSPLTTRKTCLRHLKSLAIDTAVIYRPLCFWGAWSPSHSPALSWGLRAAILSLRDLPGAFSVHSLVNNRLSHSFGRKAIRQSLEIGNGEGTASRPHPRKAKRSRSLCAGPARLG